jgi:polyphosphate kinase 2
VFRVVALPAPSDRDKTQIFLQRYIQHFPSGGEIIIFDRSWYNRAGVEYVMGFCSPDEHRRFLELCPQIEKYIVDAGIILIKLWLEVSKEEQERRFKARIDDPLRQWKLSPMDTESYRRWYDYSRARDLMLKATNSKHAPWTIVRSDDKRQARLNCIAHLLRTIPFKKISREKVRLPKRSDKGRYNDQAGPRDPGRAHRSATVTPPTAADNSTPTLPPANSRITPFSFCKVTPPAPPASAAPAPRTP